MDLFFTRSINRTIWLLVLGLAILLCDFLSKAYVFHILSRSCVGRGCIELPIFSFLGIDFSIGLATNKGAAWGLFANFQLLLLVIRFLVILGMLLYLFFINQDLSIEAPLVIIISGALGNVIDYFLYGFVIDFLHFNLWGYNFPVFNVADSAITIGVIWLLAKSFLMKKTRV